MKLMKIFKWILVIITYNQINKKIYKICSNHKWRLILQMKYLNLMNPAIWMILIKIEINYKNVITLIRKYLIFLSKLIYKNFHKNLKNVK